MCTSIDPWKPLLIFVDFIDLCGPLLIQLDLCWSIWTSSDLCGPILISVGLSIYSLYGLLWICAILSISWDLNIDPFWFLLIIVDLYISISTSIRNCLHCVLTYRDHLHTKISWVWGWILDNTLNCQTSPKSNCLLNMITPQKFHVSCCNIIGMFSMYHVVTL